MDELFIDEGDQHEMHSQDVGHLFGEFNRAGVTDSPGRRDGRVFPIPPICLFGTAGQVL